MVTDNDVLEVQRLYPQIYLACHKRHVRAASTSFRVSSQDASLLVHLDHESAMSPHSLAAHLGVKPSTLSAAIFRLAKLGYLDVKTSQKDRRKRELRLTKRGVEAIRSASVLDCERVLKMLQRLTEKQKQLALQGLALLARAAKES
jgi:DNA-binding MarR family transcriptional regulator